MRVFLDRRGKEQSRQLSDLHRRAKEDAERIVAFIRDTYRPTRILQWGSVIQPEQFREYSDIDIAVEGITGAEARTTLEVIRKIEDYYTALETFFLRVSQTFENNLSPARWHAALLDKMILEIDDIWSFLKKSSLRFAIPFTSR